MPNELNPERLSETDAHAQDIQDLTAEIDVLREEPRVSPAWRASLAAALAEEVAPSQRLVASHDWRTRTLLAFAAGIVGIVVGAWSTQHGYSATREMPLAATPVGETKDTGVRFSIVAPGVRQVSVVGDFNGWNANSTPLRLARDGVTWSATLPLPSGRHTYAFVVDGEVMADPAAPNAPENDFGVPNSLLLVSSLK